MNSKRTQLHDMNFITFSEAIVRGKYKLLNHALLKVHWCVTRLVVACSLLPGASTPHDVWKLSSDFVFTHDRCPLTRRRPAGQCACPRPRPWARSQARRPACMTAAPRQARGRAGRAPTALAPRSALPKKGRGGE